jgi:hypothetical protein
MAWPIGPGERVTNAIFLLPNITDAALARRLPAFSVLAWLFHADVQPLFTP